MIGPAPLHDDGPWRHLDDTDQVFVEYEMPGGYGGYLGPAEAPPKSPLGFLAARSRLPTRWMDMEQAWEEWQ